MEFEVSFSRTKKTIHIDNIDMVEADTKYLNLYTEGRIYIYSGTIKKIMEECPGVFIEVSRGKLVKPNLISHLERDIQGYYKVTLNKYTSTYPKFRVARRSVERLKELFDVRRQNKV